MAITEHKIQELCEDALPQTSRWNSTQYHLTRCWESFHRILHYDNPAIRFGKADCSMMLQTFIAYIIRVSLTRTRVPRKDEISTGRYLQEKTARGNSSNTNSTCYKQSLRTKFRHTPWISEVSETIWLVMCLLWDRISAKNSILKHDKIKSKHGDSN